jgi:hypothetical protein
VRKKPLPGSPEEMVDFGGTLVPVEVAERRSFFSMFLQVCPTPPCSCATRCHAVWGGPPG